MKEKVYGFLKTVPKGKVVTYGQIAEAAGNSKAARAVGNILHRNPDGENIPCYKAVASKGKLSANYAFGGIEKQRERLEKEGIEVENFRVDLNKYKL